MKKLLYLYITICIGILGCSKTPTQKYPRYKDFPIEKEITGEVIGLDTVIFRYPLHLRIKENYAIVLDLHNADYSLHLFSYPEWKHLTAFCPKGDGPEEMRFCINFHFASLDTIWALDPNKSKIFRYSISPEKNNVTLSDIITLNEEILPFREITITPDYFITPDKSGHKRYVISDKEGNFIKSEGIIPHESEEEPSFQMSEGWHSYLAYHPHKNLLAVATQTGEVLEIYNLNENLHKVMYGPGGAPTYRTDQAGEIAPTNMNGFKDIQITDNFIYTVFDGTTMKEIREFYLNGGSQRIQGGYYVQVYTHEGEPVKRYKLDHPISCIDVHEEEGYFFAADVNEDDPILKYYL